MRAFPLARPVRRALPKPAVSKCVVRQPVHLRPMGNTVAVSTLADNPFEDGMGAPVTIITQGSGGMSRPDAQQVSRRLLFLGDDATSAKTQPGALDILNTVITGAGDVFREREKAKQAAATAERAKYEAASAESKARTDAILATMARPGANMAAHKSISIPLLVIGGVALAAAGFLFMKRRKG